MPGFDPERRKPLNKPGARKRNVATLRHRAGRNTPENPGGREADVATPQGAGRKTPENLPESDPEYTHEPTDWSKEFAPLLNAERCAGDQYRSYVARQAHLMHNATEHGYPMNVHVCDRHAAVSGYYRRCADCRLCACRTCLEQTVARAAWNGESWRLAVRSDRLTCGALLSTNHAMCGFCGRSDNFVCVGDGSSSCASCWVQSSVDAELVVLSHRETCRHVDANRDYSEGNFVARIDEFGLPKVGERNVLTPDHHVIDLGFDYMDAPIPSAPESTEGILIEVAPVPDLVDLGFYEEDLFRPVPRLAERLGLRLPRFDFSVMRTNIRRQLVSEGWFSEANRWLYECAERPFPPPQPAVVPMKAWRKHHPTPCELATSRRCLRKLPDDRPFWEWHRRADQARIDRHNSGRVFTTIPMPVTHYFRRVYLGDGGISYMFTATDPTRRIGMWTSTVPNVRNPGKAEAQYRRALFMTRDMEHRISVSQSYVRSLPDLRAFKEALQRSDSEDSGIEEGQEQLKQKDKERVVPNVAMALSADNNVVENAMTILPWNRHPTDPQYRPYVHPDRIPEVVYASVLTRTVGMPIDQTAEKAVANFARNFIKSNFHWLDEMEVLRVMTIVQYKWLAQVSPIDNAAIKFATKHTSSQVQHISKLRTGAVLRSRFFGLWKSYEQVIPKTT